MLHSVKISEASCMKNKAHQKLSTLATGFGRAGPAEFGAQLPSAVLVDAPCQAAALTGCSQSQPNLSLYMNSSKYPSRFKKPNQTRNWLLFLRHTGRNQRISGITPKLPITEWFPF